ncbi:hypothetical protein NPIL_56201 [Nephila pilipes]|uniref:Uncharacterized protein n=1 Tax=Nephila pilipes TaxID=299642 RepID=A0A8X6NX39_NEPPI|nr:hypothetical protein NPIL_56201 [Nephila pilipes]
MCSTIGGIHQIHNIYLFPKREETLKRTCFQSVVEGKTKMAALLKRVTLDDQQDYFGQRETRMQRWEKEYFVRDEGLIVINFQ